MKQSFGNLFSARRPALQLAGRIGFIAAAVSGMAFSGTPLLADISLRVEIEGPPAPRHEVIVERDRPGPDYVWVDGYWDGSPGHYVWARGHWDRPPHGHGHWVAPRWEKDHDGHFHQVRGEWRD